MTNTDRIVTDPLDKFIGVQLPMNNSKYGYFNPSVITLDQVKSNIKNLLLTNKGERIMQPEFGCDIYKLLFEPISEFELKENIESIVRDQMVKWLPYIKIDNIEVTVENKDKNMIDIKLAFSMGPEIVEELEFTIFGSKQYGDR